MTFLVGLLKLPSGSKVSRDEDSNFWLLLAPPPSFAILDKGLKKIKGGNTSLVYLDPLESFWADSDIVKITTDVIKDANQSPGSGL